MLPAVTVDPGVDGVLSQAEFDSAQNAAGVNGRVVFRRDMRTSQAISVNVRGLTMVGNKPGGGRVRIVRDSVNATVGRADDSRDLNRVPADRVDPAARGASLFRINESNISFTNFHFRAQHTPVLDRNIAHDSGESANAAIGIDQAIRVLGQHNNLSVTNCTIDRLNVGVWYRRGNLPDGLEMKDIDATVAKGILNCVESPTTPVPRQSLNNPMILDDMVANYRLVRNRNFVSVAMVDLDYGNYQYTSSINSDNIPVIDCNESRINNCRALGMASWGIGINRVRNMRITGCNFTVGNFKDVFVNAFHIEAAANNIVVADTVMRVNRVNGDVIRNGTSIFSGIGGRSQHPPFDIFFENCRYRGAPDAILIGIYRDWTFRGRQDIRVDESELRSVSRSGLRSGIARLNFFGRGINDFRDFPAGRFLTGDRSIRQVVDEFNESRGR